MNADVTIRTVLILGACHVVRSREHRSARPIPAIRRSAVVTLQTHRENHRTSKQARVRGTVRRVAHLTTLNSNGPVLKHERSALVGMAFQARLLAGNCLRYKMRTSSHAPRRKIGAMRVVAVRTIHNAFIHAVAVRQFKIAAHVVMASVTKLTLCFCE